MELKILENYCDSIVVKKNCEFVGFGLMGKNIETKGRIFFVGDKAYIDDFLKLESAGVICTQEVYDEIKVSYNGGIAVSENPRGCFFYSFEKSSVLNNNAFNTVIMPDSNIHHTAIIAKKNVKIGKNVMIGANAVIHEGVIIEDDVVIEENCVIGCVPLYSYKYKNVKRTLSTRGKTIIGKGCHIHIGSMVDSGIFDFPTLIGDYTTVGGMSLIGHNTNIGSNCMLGGRNITGGWVNMLDDVYSGISVTYAPNVHVGKNAYMCAGSVVLKNVKDNVKVMGNPARRI